MIPVVVYCLIWMVAGAGATSIPPWFTPLRPEAMGTLRPSTWELTRISVLPGVSVLVAPGPEGAIDVWAEDGARDVHIPDEAFWEILDQAAMGVPFEERDPTDLEIPGRARATQIFRSSGPKHLRWAAVLAPQGHTRLRIWDLPMESHFHSAALRLAVARRVFPPGHVLESSAPCRRSPGTCLEIWSNPDGGKWTIRRSRGDGAWESALLEVPGSPWWEEGAQAWSALLSEMPPRERKDLLASWIGSRLGGLVAQHLRPGAALLEPGVEGLAEGRVQGLNLDSLARDLAMRNVLPDTLVVLSHPPDAPTAHIVFHPNGATCNFRP